MRAAIVIIGDEILSGHTLDTNSNYLAKRLFHIGVDLVEVRTVPDTATRIQGTVWELQERREADVVLTCGGVGPTHDDRTMAALANLHGVPLVKDQATWDWLLERRQRLIDEGRTNVPTLNEASRKMALVPKGAQVFQNTLGAAPGIAITRRLVTRPGTAVTLVSAGVPEEVHNLWVRAFEPYILERLAPGTRRTVHEVVYHGYESEVARTLTEVEAAHPGVSIGSYPQWGKKRVILRAAGTDAALVASARDALVHHLREAGHDARPVDQEAEVPTEPTGAPPNA